MSVEALRTASAGRGAVDWSPYLVGAGIGVLSWVVFVVVANPLGITTSLSALAGGALVPVLGWEAVLSNAYWKRHVAKLDYGTLFLLGTFLGAMASALAARTWRIEAVPRVWAERFGPSVTKRFVWALVGGAITMYGARLANGCTSGNGISQGLQLAVVGWTFILVMFAAGLLTTWILYRRPTA